MKRRQDYFVGDTIGVHEIMEILGPKEIKGRKVKTIEIFYKTRCKLCGHEREINQRSLKNGGAGASYYCFHCPLSIQREGKKRKQTEYDKNKRDKNRDCLDRKDSELFRLAIYGKLS